MCLFVSHDLLWLSRELMGVMTVGALARGLMLQGEHQMKVVLMIVCVCVRVCVKG